MTKEQAQSLARFRAAQSFRFTDGRPKLDPDIARIASGHTNAVSPAMVRYLVDRGWLVRPAAGQYVVTEVGLKKLVTFLAKENRK